jgi:hypothetical protein
MRTAHLILTYTDPKQTERMIRKMTHENFDFYIHVDKKFDIQPHLFLKEIPNVYFIDKRTDVKWAGFNTVLATFGSIREIVATGIKYDFINLLSGQDYPLISADAMGDFFKQNIGNEFISYRDIKNDWTEGQIRMDRYFLTNYNFKGKHTLEKLINFLMPVRKFPYNMHPYGKSMFWMLSPEAAMYVVEKVENDKKLYNFFLFCWGSDEFVFQTILMNSPYKERIVNKNYRYIDWSLGGANPKILDDSDFESIKESDMLFARKMSAIKSEKLFDLIDQKIDNVLY